MNGLAPHQHIAMLSWEIQASRIPGYIEKWICTAHVYVGILFQHRRAQKLYTICICVQHRYRYSDIDIFSKCEFLHITSIIWPSIYFFGAGTTRPFCPSAPSAPSAPAKELVADWIIEKRCRGPVLQCGVEPEPLVVCENIHYMISTWVGNNYCGNYHMEIMRN